MGRDPGAVACYTVSWMRDTGRRLQALALVATMSTCVGSAAADLAWAAPAECPSAAEVSHEVERLLEGSEYPLAALNEFSLTVRQDASTRLFVVHIVRAGGSTLQERSVEAANCNELVQAAALAVALAINPELEAKKPVPATATAASGAGTAGAAAPGAHAPAVAGTVAAGTVATTTTAAPPVAQAPVVQPGPQANPAAPASTAVPATNTAPVAGPVDEAAAETNLAADTRGLQVSAFGLVTADSGSMPEPGFGFGAGAGVTRQALRAQLSLEYFAPTETEPDPSGAFARFSLYRAHASGCYTPFAERFSLFGCAALEVGLLRARGQDVSDGQQVDRAWLAAGADLLLLGEVADRVSLQLRAGVVRPLIERDYVLNGDSVHQVSSWVVAGALGAEFRFN